MRWWVCGLQLLLVFASSVILRIEFRGAHDHNLLSRIRDSPNLEGQVSVFISPHEQGDPVLFIWAGGGPTENTASSIVACWFTAAEMCLPHRCIATSAALTHRQSRLQHLLYCCVTSQRKQRVSLLRVYGPLPSNGCFSASAVLALMKYSTVLDTGFDAGNSYSDNRSPRDGLPACHRPDIWPWTMFHITPVYHSYAYMYWTKWHLELPFLYNIGNCRHIVIWLSCSKWNPND
jgi:hypothetical protein